MVFLGLKVEFFPEARTADVGTRGLNVQYIGDLLRVKPDFQVSAQAQIVVRQSRKPLLQFPEKILVQLIHLNFKGFIIHIQI